LAVDRRNSSATLGTNEATRQEEQNETSIEFYLEKEPASLSQIPIDITAALRLGFIERHIGLIYGILCRGIRLLDDRSPLGRVETCLLATADLCRNLGPQLEGHWMHRYNLQEADDSLKRIYAVLDSVFHADAEGSGDQQVLRHP